MSGPVVLGSYKYQMQQKCTTRPSHFLSGMVVDNQEVTEQSIPESYLQLK